MTGSFSRVLSRWGQFHHISRKYLPLYLGEISYRYNMRRNASAFDNLLHLASNP